MTPRLYRRPGLPPAIQIRADAAGIALESGQAWRKEKIEDILSSKRALTVLKSREIEGGGDDLRAENVGDDESLPVSAAGSTLPESITASVNVSPGAKNAKELFKERAAADQLAITGFGGKMVLTVCYGRPSEVLGTIEVSHFTTYAMAKNLTRPLVEAYLASLGKLSMAEHLIDSFSVLDPDGMVVQGNQLGVRTVWEEASVNNYTLLLRPGNWIDLPRDEAEAENDEEDVFGDEEDEEMLREGIRVEATSGKAWYK
jgi:hypothetical protein